MILDHRVLRKEAVPSDTIEGLRDREIAPDNGN